MLFLHLNNLATVSASVSIIKPSSKRAKIFTSQTCSLIIVIRNSNCYIGKRRLEKDGNEKKLRYTNFFSDFTVTNRKTVTTEKTRVRLARWLRRYRCLLPRLMTRVAASRTHTVEEEN